MKIIFNLLFYQWCIMRPVVLYNLLFALLILTLFPDNLRSQALSLSDNVYSYKSVSLTSNVNDSVANPLPAKNSDRIAKPSGMKMMNSPGKGALTGFVIGGIGGVILGLTGKDWVLDNGKVVSRPVHAIVDAFIVGAPLALMGTVWGARRDRETLEPSRWHIAIGGGWSGVKSYRSMLNAASLSGLPRHIPHWFGYLHYPDGENSSTPYTWNLTVDYNLTKKFSTGISFNNFVKQQIAEGIDPHEPGDDYEFAMGESYSVLADYIINPIIPENKTRLVFAFGGGLTLHRLVAGGVLGETEYSVKKYNVTTHWRGTVDYMSRKDLSLQLKIGYRPRQTLTVPEQSGGGQTLVAHAINFRALDVTIGIRYHFNQLPF